MMISSQRKMVSSSSGGGTRGDKRGRYDSNNLVKCELRRTLKRNICVAKSAYTTRFGTFVLSSILHRDARYVEHCLYMYDIDR